MARSGGGVGQITTPPLTGHPATGGEFSLVILQLRLDYWLKLGNSPPKKGWQA